MENIGQLTAEEINQNQVTLVVPSTGDSTRLQKFTERVTHILAARPAKIVGSWRETLITLELNGQITMPNMIEKLVTMPEVEGAEEKQIKNQARQKGILVTLASSATDDYRSGEPAQDAGILVT